MRSIAGAKKVRVERDRRHGALAETRSGDRPRCGVKRLPQHLPSVHSLAARWHPQVGARSSVQVHIDLLEVKV